MTRLYVASLARDSIALAMAIGSALAAPASAVGVGAPRFLRHRRARQP
ncbi:MAG: hypothetical protein ACREON_13635 [Gemmatimonadaceae bacterium]